MTTKEPCCRNCTYVGFVVSPGKNGCCFSSLYEPSCRRYPEAKDTSENYWCGEWRHFSEINIKRGLRRLYVEGYHYSYGTEMLKIDAWQNSEVEDINDVWFQKDSTESEEP